jgi:hypothetical protein
LTIPPISTIVHVVDIGGIVDHHRLEAIVHVFDIGEMVEITV